jgi:hypothetical protein
VSIEAASGGFSGLPLFSSGRYHCTFVCLLELGLRWKVRHVEGENEEERICEIIYKIRSYSSVCLTVYRRSIDGREGFVEAGSKAN